MSSSESWSPVRRVGFRFAFAYFVLYCGLEVPGSIFPGIGWLWPYASNALRHAMASLGNKVIHPAAPIVVGDGGSGDTIVNDITLACVFALAATTTVVWSIVDRRREAYPKLHDLLRGSFASNWRSSCCRTGSVRS